MTSASPTMAQVLATDEIVAMAYQIHAVVNG